MSGVSTWTELDEKWFQKECKKDAKIQEQIKNGTHTRHTYDIEARVYNPELEYYEWVCESCGKVKGSHGRKGWGMNKGDHERDVERWKIYAEIEKEKEKKIE